MEDKKKILVVEDMDAIRDIVSATLSLKGYIIYKASDGKEALELLQKEPGKYDLIMSDFDMPGLNGLELLDKVRSTPSTKDMPFIMLTSRSDPEQIKAAKAKGLSAWIMKPYKVDTFIAQVQYAIKNK